MMRRLLLVIITILIVTMNVNQRQIGAQMIVAHRGASADAPENTLAAFHLAWKQGADAIEGDFCLSKDGEIVCIHDKDTTRTAGVELIVNRTNFTDLRRLDVGSWVHRSFEGEKIPTLAEVLAIVPRGKKIFVEIKCGPEIVPKLKSDLDACNLRPEQIAIISFKESVIAETRKQIPNIKAHWLTGFEQDEQTGIWEPPVDEVMATLKRISADGLDAKAEAAVIDRDFVKRLREANLEFHCWTVDDASVARKFRALGVDSITTNQPEKLRKSLAKPTTPRVDTGK